MKFSHIVVVLAIIAAFVAVWGFAGFGVYTAIDGTRTTTVERTLRPTTTCSAAVCPQYKVETRVVKP